MLDRHVEKLAQLIVEYSVAVREGDLVAVHANTLADPLVGEIYAACLRCGAHPELDLTLPDLDDLFFQHASDSQLAHPSLAEQVLLERSDVQIAIVSPANTRALAVVPGERLARRRVGLKPLSDTFDRRAGSGELRWLRALFPTHALAQDASMSLRAYEALVYRACKLHHEDPASAWREQGERQQRLLDPLRNSSKVTVLAPGTDLTFSVAGRPWLSADGRTNLPDGEVYAAPVEGSVEGRVQFSYPASMDGVEVEDIRLWFEDGKVAKATASKNESFLQMLLNLDDGAPVPGEFGFGMNEEVTGYTGNALLDEKIHGTIHLALGSSAPGSQGQNRSALHWDMVVDLRLGGEVWVDGVKVQEDGILLA